MKKRVSILLSLALVLTMAVSLFVPAVNAAEASSALSVSASSVNVGNTFTVTVRVSGASIGSVFGTIGYNSNVIEFVSGDGCSGASGTVRVSKWDSTGMGVSSLSTTMTFTAKAAGSTALTFAPSEVINGDMAAIECSGASANVSVVSPQPLSGNANLASLKLSAGTLSPAFSANTTSYSVMVENRVSKVTVAAVAADKGAKTAISGSDNLAVGANTRTITVTAPNGTTKKYTVRITRKAADGSVSQAPVPSEEPVPVGPAVTVSVGGKTMTVVEDLEGIEIPAGFSPDEQVLNDTSVVCLRNEAGLVLLYLTGEEGDGFYLYDNESISFTPYTVLTVGGIDYIPLVKSRNVALPHGFTAADVTIGETVLAGWQSDVNEDFYLLYLGGPSYVGYYLYDAQEGTLQRYVSLAEKETDAPAEPDKKPDGVLGFINDHFALVCVGAGAILLGLILALVLVALRKGHKSQGHPEEAEEDELLHDLDGMIFNFDTPTEPDSEPDNNFRKEDE